jgi:hypothetical protein
MPANGMGNTSNNSISYRMGVPHNDYQLIFGPKNNAPTKQKMIVHNHKILVFEKLDINMSRQIENLVENLVVYFEFR